MSLREEVVATANPKCAMARLRDLMEGGEYSELLELVGDSTVSTTALARVLRNKGLAVARTTLDLHRQKGCQHCR